MEKPLALVREVEKAVGVLRRLARVDRDVFLGDEDKRGSAKYHLVVSVEAAIDLCQHLISVHRWDVPEEYADTVRIVGREAKLPGELIERLEQMVRFRNLLVHVYGKVDDARVWDVLQRDLGDFDLLLSGLRKAGVLPSER
jgi:uncharacterized protein YutE (UPF0331/DUF86 family)